jgi:hypothetical protein
VTVGGRVVVVVGVVVVGVVVVGAVLVVDVVVDCANARIWCAESPKSAANATTTTILKGFLTCPFQSLQRNPGAVPAPLAA